MQVWNVLHGARWKYRTQKSRKTRHLRTIAHLCRAWIFATKAYIDNRKNALNINISFTCPHNVANFGPLAAEIGSGVWGTPSNFNGFSSLDFVTAATSFTGGQPNVVRCLAVSWAGTLYIHFRGLLPPDGISQHAKFTLRPSIAFSYIGSVTARHSSSGVSQTLRRGTRNGITELSQRAPPIFGWAAITLRIGPQSSLVSGFTYETRQSRIADFAPRLQFKDAARQPVTTANAKYAPLLGLSDDYFLIVLIAFLRTFCVLLRNSVLSCMLLSILDNAATMDYWRQVLLDNWNHWTN